MKVRLALRAGLASAGLALALALPGLARAHEHRNVASDYEFVVGFLKEPAYEGEPNGIDLTVTRRSRGAPVEGLEKTLQVEVTMGGDSLPLPLQPRFRQPGAYNGEFVPTRAGTYYFLIRGTLEGTPIEELFESGPGRFDDVTSVAPLQFPDKVPAGTDLQRALASAESRATVATAVGAIGLVVGLAAAGLATWVLMARGREARGSSATPGLVRRGPRQPATREQL
jgi:hypothetical protein